MARVAVFANGCLEDCTPEGESRINGAVDGVRFSGGGNGGEKQASRGSRAVITLLVTPER